MKARVLYIQDTSNAEFNLEFHVLMENGDVFIVPSSPLYQTLYNRKENFDVMDIIKRLYIDRCINSYKQGKNWTLDYIDITDYNPKNSRLFFYISDIDQLVINDYPHTTSLIQKSISTFRINKIHMHPTVSKRWRQEVPVKEFAVVDINPGIYSGKVDLDSMDSTQRISAYLKALRNYTKDNYLTTQEYAEKIGKSVEQVKIYCRQGRLDAIKTKDGWRINPNSPIPEDKRKKQQKKNSYNPNKK